MQNRTGLRRIWKSRVTVEFLWWAHEVTSLKCHLKTRMVSFSWELHFFFSWLAKSGMCNYTCHKRSKLYYSAGCFPTFKKHSLVRFRFYLKSSAPLESSDIIVTCSLAVCDAYQGLKVLRNGFIQIREACRKQHSCRAKRREGNVLLIPPWGCSLAISSFNRVKNWTQIPLSALDSTIGLYSFSLCFKYSVGSSTFPLWLWLFFTTGNKSLFFYIVRLVYFLDVYFEIIEAQ